MRSPGSLCRASIGPILIAMALAACTTQEPPPPDEDGVEEEDDDADATPASVREVVVILPPGDALDPATVTHWRDQVDAATDLLSGVDDVRAVVPDDARFVEDLLRSFAERRPDVLCVVDPVDEAALQRLAERYPDVGVCALGGAAPIADEDDADEDLVRRTVLRFEEVGYVVGAVLRERAGLDATVGLVLGDAGPRAGAFRDGLLAGIGDLEVIEADVPAGEDVSLVERLEAVLAAGASHVVFDPADGATDAVAAVDGRARLYAPAEILAAAGLEAAPGAADAGSVGLTWDLRWAPTLAGPAGSLGDGGARTRVLGVLALARFEVGSPGSDALQARVRQLRRGLVRGEIDPLVPQVRPEPVPDADDEPAEPDEPDEVGTVPDADADDGGATDD
ncbi:MAG: hypothetical protein JJT89_07705 [Nitriliruptoraceae bacterium]|nr:hypothetical protein [Nitriliruptoraceae bacterium]